MKYTKSVKLLKLTRNLNLAVFLALAMSMPSHANSQESEAILLKAARIFDGKNFRQDTSILLKDGKIAKVYSPDSIIPPNVKVMNLGDATILPGFIELHSHLTFRNVSGEVVLKHGVTTVRDLGGPVHKPYGGKGALRVITSGPIITAANGYPIPNMGAKNIAIPVSTNDEARKTVRDLVNGGASIIKIALEPGGTKGAPWSNSHVHGKSNLHIEEGHGKSNPHGGKDGSSHSPSKHKPSNHKTSHLKHSWPLLPIPIVRSIVDEAHKFNRKVIAHVSEEKGVQIAIDSGVDEWAHVPCNAIPESLLKKAISKSVKNYQHSGHTIQMLRSCTQRR